MPQGFHHEHKSKGVAVATDLDDGKPSAYDLPSPTTDGAIGLRSAKDTDGKPLSNGVNGHVTKDEDERWIERTGWAPRFGNGAGSIEAEPTLADHQTWIEGKLEDKFFGGKFSRLDLSMAHR